MFFSAPQLKRDPLGAHAARREPSTQPSRSSFSQAAYAASTFALYFAGVSFLRALVGVPVHHLPLFWIVGAPLLSFAIFFTFALLLQVFGAVSLNPDNHLQLDVNPWFAWLLCGGLVAFFVGSLASGHEEGSVMLRRGEISVAIWVVAVVLAWTTNRLFVRRGA